MTENRLFEDVVKLTSTGSRRVGSVGHRAAREFLVSRLEELNLQKYHDSSFVLSYASDFANIVACIPGLSPEAAPILLGAHYDTCGDIPGADDNAAAVAVLLHTAEILLRSERERPVIVAFFDGEEPPNFLQPEMGSIRFYEDQRLGSIYAAIILDLVGHDVPVLGMEDILFITGAESDPQLANIVARCEPGSGLRTVPILNNYVGDLSDHHIFRVNERPYLLLTCGHWEHYHQKTDTPDRLNFSKMAAISRYLVCLTGQASGVTLSGPFDGGDTLGTEIKLLRKNVLPSLAAIGAEPPLENRLDVDSLVYGIMSRFGL
jgi:hypothetical protein